MTIQLIDTATIPGWGVDADVRNDPTYPMRHREDQGASGLSWKRPVLQRPNVEILSSIEHNRSPAVVGTSTPPSGLSGAIRRRAFRRSESDWWHWLMLMGADRIGVVEGVIDDVASGKLPNIPAEMGARAAWRHDRPGFVLKAGATAVIATALVATIRSWANSGSDMTDLYRQGAASRMTQIG